MFICASGSAVEHLLAKEGVAGSIPVSRSFFILRGALIILALRIFYFIQFESAFGVFSSFFIYLLQTENLLLIKIGVNS